jgi:hypothetical protein
MTIGVTELVPDMHKDSFVRRAPAATSNHHPTTLIVLISQLARRLAVI